MKKFILVLVLALALFSLPRFALAYTYTVIDPVNNYWTGGNANNFDRIGAAVYEIYKATVTTGGSTVQFDILTNFPQGGNQVSTWYTKPADLALDLDGNGTYECGVAFRDHDGFVAGGLYSVSAWYESDDYKPSGGYIYHQDQIVSMKTGTEIRLNNSLSWIGTFDPNSKYTNTAHSTADFDIRLVLNSSDLPLAHGAKWFYGGATCANDYIGGFVAPEPASLSLLGLGLFGLLGRGLRRKKS